MWFLPFLTSFFLLFCCIARLYCNCIKNWLPDRHSSIKLCPCVIKFSQCPCVIKFRQSVHHTAYHTQLYPILFLHYPNLIIPARTSGLSSGKIMSLLVLGLRTSNCSPEPWSEPGICTGPNLYSAVTLPSVAMPVLCFVGLLALLVLPVGGCSVRAIE